MKVKGYLLLLGVLVSLENLRAQVVFNYDAGGNVIERKIQVINSGARFGQTTPTQEIKGDSTLSFKIYPNPTNETNK